MKLITILFVVLGLLSNSAQTAAEGPIPFSALEHAGSGNPGTPAMPIPANDPATATSQPTHRGQMTTGGKVMTGVGIAMLGIGAALIGFGASVGNNRIGGSEIKSVGLGAGAGFAGIGSVLIIVGTHRRKAQ